MSESAEYEMLRLVVRPVIARASPPSPEMIRETIGRFRGVAGPGLSDDDVEALAREIESQFDIRMTLGSVVQDGGFVEWYPAAKAEIEPYYWDRYRQLMEEKNFAPQVLATLDSVTDRIAGLLQNPEMPGDWDRRGMVVGHVQSGKTANYTGLICKAADAGYKLIVVIAGIHNNLRNQTQQRIDEGFVGKDSGKPNKPFIGVSRFSAKQTPITLTNATSDFNTRIAESAGMDIRSLNVPLVLVIKKNTSTLRNLTNWLRAHNTGWTKSLVDAPMLLIDDEADNASINISANPGETSRINRLIRELLNLFNRKCYVGYTATPFANIFINPDADEELQADLFPKHFIVTLDPPTNYFGASKIFQEETGGQFLRDITDNGDLLPLVHRIDLTISDLPDSLKQAVRTFVLARAVRILRGQGGAHTSMLVNASRFTNVQKQLRNTIHDYLDKVIRAARHDGAKSENDALRNAHLRALKDTWDAEFSHLGFGWDQVQANLLEAAAPIQVVEVNSTSSGKLAYSAHEETGLQVIAVGGFSLSRGLTLEGLTVSYFLRNSMMYDTLLQMGRWFGYRPGYEDLCRIWMPPEARGWYEHISESIEELRDELRRMERAGMTPEDFGLRVRTHPDTLIVTARNKMRTAQAVPVSIGLSGKFIETYALRRNAADVAANRDAARDLVWKLEAKLGDGRGARSNDRNRVWTEVPGDLVEAFVRRFKNADRSLPTQSGPVADFIHAGLSAELSVWDVAVVGKADGSGTDDPDFGVTCQRRAVGRQSNADYVLVGEKNRVSSRGVEKIGVPKAEQESAEADYREAHDVSEGANYPDGIYRARRERPLLLIQPLDLREGEKPLPGKPLVGWSISFPATTFDYRTVTYVVNSTWWRDYVGDPDEVEDEDLGFDEA